MQTATGRIKGEGRAVALLVLLAVALWAIWTLPLALGERTLSLRDVFRTHAPYKAFGARALAAGEIPAINPEWGLGQPFAGNPSTVAFYPGNLLYLVLPFWSAFNLHFALHWLLGFFGMRALARALGQSDGAALVAALTWSASGYVLTLLSLYNLIGIAAWAPWILAGLVRGDRRGLAGSALATGLALLAGEPLTALLLAPAMVVAAAERATWVTALRRVAIAGAGGLLVALPQIVATARILGFTDRAAIGVPAVQATSQSLSLLRLLELVLPLPWGWPADRQHFEFWSSIATPRMPYIFSLHVGIVGLALALAAISRRRRWAALAAAGLFVSWAGGWSGELTQAISFGLFRYPQKALLLFTLAAALLAGWGVDRCLAEPDRFRRRLLLGAGAFLTLAALFAAAQRPIARALVDLARARAPEFASRAAAIWTVGFVLAGFALLLAGWAVHRRSAGLLAIAQAIALAGLAPAVVTDALAPYREAPAISRPLAATSRAIGDAPAILPVTFFVRSWDPLADAAVELVDLSGAPRIGYQALEPLYGVEHPALYPLLPPVEGMVSPLAMLIVNNLTPSPWPVRMEWLRRLGVDWVVRLGERPVEGLERIGTARVDPIELGLDRVLDSSPRVRWPAAVVATASPLDAYERIATGSVPRDAVAASRAVAHRPGASVAMARETPDALSVDVEGEGGLLVVERAWLPIYRAQLADGTPLATQPVDVALLGVEVPAGKQRVEISISHGPEKLAGAIALVVAAGLALLAGKRTYFGESRTAAG